MKNSGWFRSLLCLLACALVMSSLPWPATADDPEAAGSGAVAQGYQQVASNAYLELYTPIEGASVGTFAVRNRADGSVWYSNPLDAREDGVSISIASMLSLLEISVYDAESGVLLKLNSYADSVSEQALSLSAIKNGLRFSFSFPAVGITLPVSVVLEDAALCVTADIKAMKEERDAYLFDLSLLPYFCVGGPADEGWLLVPDGSGALLRLNNGKTGYGPYACPVYGGDAVTAPDTRPTDIQPASLPVFGVKRGDSAMLAILTDGAAHSTVKAITAGVDSQQNAVWSVAAVRKASTYKVDNGWQGASMTTVYPDTAPDIPAVSLRYAFLAGEAAGLSGMAQVCREYWHIGEGQRAAPVVVDTLGAVRKKTTFLGFPAWRDRRITDFAAAQEMLSALRDGGVTELSLRYLGWDKQSVHGRMVSGFQPLPLLGGKAGLRELAGWTADNGVGFYPDVNWQQYSHNAFPFQQYFVAARDYNNQLATRFFYKRNLLNRDRDLPTYWLLSHTRLQKNAASFLKAFGKSGAQALSVSGVGSLLYSDNSGKTAKSAEESLLGQLTLLDGAKSAAGSLMVAAPYPEAAVRADVVVDMPASSGFDMLDEAVPFYQMVLAGAAAYCGRAVNLQDDPDAAFLRALSYGEGLHYALIAEPGVDKLRDTAYESWMSCYAADWTSTVIRQSAAMRAVYGELGGGRLVDYEVPAQGVSRSTFAGGGVLLVNTGSTAVTVGQTAVPARGYTVIKGAA